MLSSYIPACLRSGLHMSTLTVGTLFTLIMAASIAGPLVAENLAILDFELSGEELRLLDALGA